MSMFQEKFTQFKAKKAELEKLDAEVAPKIEAIEKEFKEKLEVLKAEYNDRINEARRDFDNASSKYQAELKAWCGITEGEKAEVLLIVDAIRKVSEME
jgi:hypothetical protein